MTTALSIYLRDHEAAAQGGLDLFRRAARNQRGRPWGGELAALRDEVGADLRSLRSAMKEFGVRPDLVLGLSVRVAERAGRWKPNGRLIGRAALSDLIEIEAAQDAVQAKANGWRALISAELRPATVDLSLLRARAERQRERLRELHATVARRVLHDGRPTGDIGES